MTSKNGWDKNGFALIELAVTATILLLLGVGGYLWLAKSTPTPMPTRQTTTEQEPSADKPTPLSTSTPLPTLPPLQTDTSDQTINQAAQEVNTLMGELNGLDKIDSELELPKVDFSTDF